MNYKRFLEVSKEFWNQYLDRIFELYSQGLIINKDEDGVVCKTEILFPTILLLTETKHFFLTELIGAKKIFEGLIIKGHKETSIERYFNQFNSNNPNFLFKITDNNTFSKICLSGTAELENLKSRFPAINLLKSFLITSKSELEYSPFKFDNNSNFFVVRNSLLINKCKSFFRAKYVLHATAIQKSTSGLKYNRWLKEKIYSEIQGVHSVNSIKAEDFAVASQFTNTYLMTGLRETTIGEFLKLHPEIIERGLKTQKFIYEPYLPWIEKTPENSDSAINPDLMIERADGFYDIYDLKTALLDRNLTRGERKRRRFVDYVQEGIAQLANYAEYFTFSQNCDYAFRKYGIKVEQPNLVLVVGHFDNANITEIEEARRQLKDINIIDYDSFLQLFLLSNNQSQ